MLSFTPPKHIFDSLFKEGLECAFESGKGDVILRAFGACDAGNEEVVARLRARKHREQKPFAVLTSSPGSLGHVSAADLALLRSPACPIVLVERRRDAPVAPAVAPGSPLLGLLLPYTPLHHLLASDFAGPLVLTSGNRSDEPIATEDDDARSRLGGIADAFLAHDRRIHRRCEDSVVGGGTGLFFLAWR